MEDGSLQKLLKLGRGKLLVQDGNVLLIALITAVTLFKGARVSDLSVFREKGAFLFFLWSSLQTWKSWVNIFLLSHLAIGFGLLSSWKMEFFYRLNIFVLRGSWGFLFFLSPPWNMSASVAIYPLFYPVTAQKCGQCWSYRSDYLLL